MFSPSLPRSHSSLIQLQGKETGLTVGEFGAAITIAYHTKWVCVCVCESTTGEVKHSHNFGLGGSVVTSLFGFSEISLCLLQGH